MLKTRASRRRRTGTPVPREQSMNMRLPAGPAQKIARAALVLLLVAGLVWVLLNRDSIDPLAIIDWAQRHAWWESALAFTALHIVASLFFIPRLFLGVAAGVMFGSLAGTVLALIAGTLGGIVGFWAVRFVNRDAVRLREAPRIGEWLEKAESQGWRFVFIVRLIPVLPHSLVNYVLGLSHISTLSYGLGTLLGMVPTTIVFVNLGVSGRDFANGTGDYALLAVWGFGLLFVSWLLPKLMRRLFPDL